MKMASRVSRVLALAGLALGVAVLAGCAPGPNELVHSPGSAGTVAGFWLGLWNGMIAPITFVLSLFYHTVQMYEVHNNGAWYNLGFLLGMSISMGGGAGGAAGRSWRARCTSGAPRC